MFRKLIIAAGATVAIAAAAFTPTAASAHGWHGHHGYHGWGRGISVGFYGPAYAYAAGPECYNVKRLVMTPYGKRWRLVTVCN
jgi:hypothetical protein